MTLFLATFFLIYGGMHVHAFLRSRGALNFGRNAGIPLGVFMLFMVFSPIAARFLEQAGFQYAARTLAWPIYTWMGFLLLFFSMSVFLDICRLTFRVIWRVFKKDMTFPSLSPARLFFFPLVLACCSAIYGFFEAGAVKTERVAIKTSKLPEGVKKIKIAQISDLHLGLMTIKTRLKRTIDIIKKEAPDILVSTGDLMDGQGAGLDGISGLFSELKPRHGKYAVTGNHEFYAGLDQALEFTKRAGFIVLRGSGMTVNGVLNIAGVDDAAGKKSGLLKEVDEKDLLSGLPGGLFTILLKHRPIVSMNSQEHFDLQLSGHTHNGQIFPFGLVVKLLYPNIAGLARLPGGGGLYSNRGSGTWGPPIRFLSPPEVAIFEIASE
ncbi:MAG: metallophosphoesterase [Nitrospinae bacterium]|nr:metallophosphoesterase [Nitrospinota bacterium]